MQNRKSMEFLSLNNLHLYKMGFRDALRIKGVTEDEIKQLESFSTLMVKRPNLNVFSVGRGTGKSLLNSLYGVKDVG